MTNRKLSETIATHPHWVAADRLLQILLSGVAAAAAALLLIYFDDWKMSVDRVPVLEEKVDNLDEDVDELKGDIRQLYGGIRGSLAPYERLQFDRAAAEESEREARVAR